jgi:hypothetical protein
MRLEVIEEKGQKNWRARGDDFADNRVLREFASIDMGFDEILDINGKVKHHPPSLGVRFALGEPLDCRVSFTLEIVMHDLVR